MLNKIKTKKYLILAKNIILFRKRQKNFLQLYEGLKQFQEYVLLPRWSTKANPSWFGFPITLAKGLDRSKFTIFLESKGIETRMIFAGNILRQPGFTHIDKRISGSLKQTDSAMERSFFIGVYPGITNEMINYMIDQIGKFLRTKI